MGKEIDFMNRFLTQPKVCVLLSFLRCFSVGKCGEPEGYQPQFFIVVLKLWIDGKVMK